jgi:hypothetical protein
MTMGPKYENERTSIELNVWTSSEKFQNHSKRFLVLVLFF